MNKKQGISLVALMYWKMQEQQTNSTQLYSFHRASEAATGTCTKQEFIAAMRGY